MVLRLTLLLAAAGLSSCGPRAPREESAPVPASARGESGKVREEKVGVERKRAPLPGARFKLSVGPLDEDLALAVLAAEVDPPPGARSALLESALHESAPHESALHESVSAQVPVQMEQDGGKTRVHFPAAELKKGSAAEWTLEFSAEPPPAPRIAARASPDGSVAVEVGGALFTRLVNDPKSPKPYLYPLLLDGAALTRHYPMEDFPGEDRDHIHHRSFWFTHGEVEEADFWSENPRAGKTVQREVRAADGGDVFARIATVNDWVAPGGKRLLLDERDLRFHDFGDRGRLIDVTLVLTAAEEPVTFGDTKEGTFGIRLAETMKEKRGGRIENSRGQVGMKNAWGKPAEWVDYSGEVGKKTFGVAILDHPESFRHPTTWHVRDYGLFAANPFGLRDFTGKRDQDGSHRLAKGDSIRFRYRVYLHPGGAAEARVAAAYAAFARPPAVRVERAGG